MRIGFILDAGVLQGIAKERRPNTPLIDRLRREPGRFVTIKEVTAECIDVHYTVLQNLNILLSRHALRWGNAACWTPFLPDQGMCHGRLINSAGPTEPSWATPLPVTLTFLPPTVP